MLDQKKLRKAQLIILDVLLEVDRICKKNNIQYWLDGGTLLGAVRHKGFIPWDDDVDICMLDSDYIKFLKIAKKELRNNYFLQTIDTDKYSNTPWARVRDRNNYTIHSNEKYHQGLGVDIFPMTLYGNINKKVYKYLFLLKEIRVTNTGKLKNLIKKILIFLKVNKLFFKYVNIDDKKINVGYKFGFSQIQEYKNIFPLLEIEFEDHKFSCPNNVNSYLRELYGDTYMELPPEKNRVWHAKEIRLNEKCFFEKELERTGRTLYEEE